MEKKVGEQSSSGIKIYLSHPLYLIKSGFLVITWMMLVSFKNLKSLFFFFIIYLFVYKNEGFSS